MNTEQSEIGTPVLTNELDFQPDFAKLDQDFDFFCLSTSEPFIKDGARCLDDPKNELKAFSFTHDRGRTAFLMFWKTQKVDEVQISKVIHRDESGNALTVARVLPNDIKSYILLRLVINSISNYGGDYAFNNLSGKLYLVHQVSRDVKNLRALEIGTDWMGHLSAVATAFSKVSVFGEAAKALLAKYPAYTREGNRSTLKRSWDTDNKDALYIRKFVPGKKPRMPFYHIPDKRGTKCKVYYLYQVIDTINKNFSAYLKKPLAYKEMTIVQEVETMRDKKFMDKVHTHFYGLFAQKVNCVNMMKPGEADSVFEDLVNLLKCYFGSDANGEVGPEVGVSDKIDYAAANIVFLHDEEFYLHPENGGPLNDPYKKLPRMDAVIQSITFEETGQLLTKKPEEDEEALDENEKKAILRTLLKEMAIKDDIIHAKEITVDDWRSLGYKSDWIFASEEEGVQHYMTIHPDGRFEFRYATPGFVPSLEEQFRPLALAMATSTDKTKTVISDCDGNINLISKTGMFVMPKKESLTMQKTRDNERAFMNGIFDIHYYEKYGKGYYSVGVPHASLQFGLSNGTLIYQVDVKRGKSIIVNVLETFSVSFVKLDGFTVLPYPFKYLREYALMELYNSGRWKEKFKDKKDEKKIM
jgi:hypothetical protein